MCSKPRLLILGLDGAAYNLMTGWMAAGHLPTFAAFARDAATAPLRCTWPPHTATGWPSLFTGQLPGEHGIFQFWNCQSPDYRLHVTQSDSVGCPMLWDVFAQQGWTVGLQNIPMSHPPGPWSGYQITWPLVPTLHYSKPLGLLRELSDVGAHVLPDIACMYTGSPDYPELTKKYIRERTKAVRHLINHQPTDVVAVVYTEIDRVSHHYWHGLDTSHPKYGRALPEERNVIADIYAEVDRAFAELLQLVDDDCVVMVVSDHGFGPGTRGLRLHHVLARGGFCSLRRIDSLSMSDIQVCTDTDGGKEFSALFDWERTQVYMPTPGCYGVNLNLKERQALGTVSKDDQQAVLRSVTEYLLGVLDPETGGSVFEAVLPATTAYAGPYAERAPDLLLVPADPALMLLHDLDGPMWDNAGQTGLHRLEGVWMLRGPNVKLGERQEAMPIEAVAGHLLATLGLSNDAIPTPDEAVSAKSALLAAGLPEGTWSICRDPMRYWSANPSTLTSSEQTSTRSPEAVKLGSIPDSNSAIIERLRTMGYM